ncbi:MAG TPA: TIGR00266 family protein, partial [Clostridia bacterium]|nr:TIGR00266 family protein [Clostridia bacterium]
MKYVIQGGQLPVVICELAANEEMFTESGSMCWMSDNMVMSTNMEGGFLKGLGRAFSGDSMFIASYRADGGPGMIAYSSSFPGNILPIELAVGQSVICQKRAFLAAQRGVTLTTHFQKKLGAGLVGGEGFILQRITGPGLAFIEIDGSVVEYNLAPNQRMKVGTGHVAMMDASVAFDITTVKGFKNVLFGGEGLFLTTLTGPGRVYLQSMPIENLAKSIIPYIPHSSN